ncbi:hypothetical protein HPB48_003500 [Haemaphysalis longicornis]|uniref:Gastric triacylglycerol lipase n=1 Tax=Haemaphysalis longicornis TaxID=44386 RepID=A0A9J6GWJ1_HAELO|nr:hypothetical protein HPB48_003500 [Haemaphysalis longicornis]
MIFGQHVYSACPKKITLIHITPPAYPLEKIQVPVALFRGKADLWADPRDIDDLVQTLHHVIVSDVTVPDPRFGHLDFVFACNATDFLHRPMINLLKNYTSTRS